MIGVSEWQQRRVARTPTLPSSWCIACMHWHGRGPAKSRPKNLREMIFFKKCQISQFRPWLPLTPLSRAQQYRTLWAVFTLPFYLAAPLHLSLHPLVLD
jgi:hypothetical protein